MYNEVLDNLIGKHASYRIWWNQIVFYFQGDRIVEIQVGIIYCRILNTPRFVKALIQKSKTVSARMKIENTVRLKSAVG